MRKILIATPVKGGLSPEYVGNLVGLLHAKIRDVHLDVNFVGGTSVALARNQLAMNAIRQGCDALIFWDKDLVAFTPQQQIDMVARLLSHAEPVVAGQYCDHNVPTDFHGCRYSEEGPNANGLLRMHQMPIGFCKIDVEALKTIMRHTPERAYYYKELRGEAQTLHEFFPTALVGPCTPEGKLERITAVLAPATAIPESKYAATLMKVVEILNDADYSTNTMYGEDFFFCKLARDAGIPLYADTTMVVPHKSEVRLPLHIDTLKAEMDAAWRVKP